MSRRIAFFAFLLFSGGLTADPLHAQCGVPSPPAPGAVPFDNLHVTPGDYRRARGFNYLAIYPSRNKLGATIRAGLPWRGVASSTAMWEEYDPDGQTAFEVHEQLRLMKTIGVNIIRVFMSYPCWHYYHQRSAIGPNQYNVRFADFLSRCEQNGIYCIPVLWDNTGAGAGNPPRIGLRNYYSERHFHAWHSNPGITYMEKALLRTGSFVGTPAETYITDLVNAANGSPAIAMWEIINEPFQFTEPLLGQVIQSTVQVLDPLTSAPILLGLPWQNHAYHQYARMSEVDVLAIHHYAHTSTMAALHSQVHNATHIRLDPTQTSATPVLHKPLILGEAGSPGFGHSYADAIDQAIRVPRLDLGASEAGIGFMSFSSNVGWQRGNYPFKAQGGVFYGDGTVRNLDDVHAFLAAAGLPTTTPLVQKVPTIVPPCPQGTPATEDSPMCAGLVRQTPISAGLDTYAERVAWVNAPSTDLLSVGVNPGCPPNFAAYVELREFFRSCYQGITAANGFASQWLGSMNDVTPPGLPNGNPYVSQASAPAPEFVLPIATVNMIDSWFAYTELQLDAANAFVPTPFTASLLAQSATPGPFDPRVHGEHLALLCLDALDPLRTMMRDYVIAQQ